MCLTPLHKTTPSPKEPSHLHTPSAHPVHTNTKHVHLSSDGLPWNGVERARLNSLSRTPQEPVVAQLPRQFAVELRVEALHLAA